MAKQKKEVRSLNHGSFTKEARVTHENFHSIKSAYDHHPVWQFKILDLDHHEWGWQNLKLQDFGYILTKLKD